MNTKNKENKTPRPEGRGFFSSQKTIFHPRSEDSGFSSKNKLDFLLKGFLSGLGWMIGATLGFTLLVTILNRLGGLPIIGNFIATLVELTNQALETKMKITG